MKYCTSRDEEHFYRYINSSNPIERERIYTKHIHSIFRKIAKGIIAKNKYKVPLQSTEETVTEVTSHLWNVLDQGYYDPEKGRAFSYFTRIAYLYVMTKVRKAYNADKKHPKVSIDSVEWNVTDYEKPPTEAEAKKEEVHSFYQHFVNHLSDNIDTILPDWTEVEVEIANCVIQLLENVEEVKDKNLKFHSQIYNLIENKLNINDNNYRTIKVLSRLREEYFREKEIYFSQN